MVVDVGLTVGVPVPTSAPPQLPLNQSMTCPAPTLAERTEDSPAQIVAGAAEALVGIAGAAMTVTVTGVQVPLVHPPDELLARA